MALGRRGGLTLVELLAAMMVLLVGVYSVAALFPKLFRNVQEDGMRSEVIRVTEQVAERFQTGADQAPADTAPFDWNVRNVDPASTPQDPDTVSVAGNPLNGRDDLATCVHGERFTVPAPAEAGRYPCYVPKCGLLAENDLGSIMIVQTKELEPALDDPGAGGGVPAGTFCLRPTGEFRAAPPTGWPAPDWYEIEYNWYDNAGTAGTADDLTKRVPREVVGVGVTVQAARASGANGRGGRVIPGSARVWAAYRWYPNVGSILTWSPAPQARDVLVDLWGQALYFPRGASGADLRMDYRVRNTGSPNNRRDLIMQEDVVIPKRPPYQIGLAFRGLDDANALMVNNFIGVPLPRPVFLMMIDMTDGWAIPWDGTPSLIAGVDFVQGIVTLDPNLVGGRMGNRVRLYYKTMGQHLLQIQKAPAEFVEVDPGGAISPDMQYWLHRTYKIGKDSGAANYTGSGVNTLLYDMPMCYEGHAVQVDYLVERGVTLPLERVSNEMHIIKDLGLAYGFGFVLNKPNVVGVQAVRGASMRVCGWWRNEQGRVSRVDTTSILFGG